MIWLNKWIHRTTIFKLWRLWFHFTFEKVSKASSDEINGLLEPKNISNPHLHGNCNVSGYARTKNNPKKCNVFGLTSFERISKASSDSCALITIFKFEPHNQFKSYATLMFLDCL